MKIIPDAALGAIAAGAVSSLVSLLGLIISKESKTSEFREAWITGLREELAVVASSICEMHVWLTQKDVKFEDARQAYEKANHATVSIRLRLNAEEEAAKALLAVLDRYEQAIGTRPLPVFEALAPIERDLINESRSLLKSEWNRVKNGEKVFQFVRAASFVILIVSVLSIGTWIWQQ